jgi:hypothetical protein
MLVMLAFAEAFSNLALPDCSQTPVISTEASRLYRDPQWKNPVFAAARGEAASAFTLLVFSTPTFRCRAFVCEILANSLIVG